MDAILTDGLYFPIAQPACTLPIGGAPPPCPPQPSAVELKPEEVMALSPTAMTSVLSEGETVPEEVSTEELEPRGAVIDSVRPIVIVEPED